VTRTILVALLSHWLRNPLQLVTLLAGLALGTALWSGVQAINAEARASYDAAASALGQGRYDQIVARDGGAIAQESYVALRRSGWLVSPLVEGAWRGITLIGIDPLTAPRDVAPVDLGTGGGDLAGFLSGEGQIFARAETLALLSGMTSQGIVSDAVAPDTALTDIGVAQRILGRPDSIDRLIVLPVQSKLRPPLAEVAPGLMVRAGGGTTDVASLTDSFHLNLTAFGLLAFAVGMFIVHGAIGLAFEQRRPMVRTLRALGAPLHRILATMALELTGLALLAGAVGVTLGYVLAAGLMPDVAATLRGLYGADVTGQLGFRPVWWLSGLAIAVGGTAVAAAGALWSIARMPLLASAQPHAWAMSRPLVLQASAALALLVLAAALALWGQGLIAGFAMLAALLIGGALALPPLLALLLRLPETLARGAVAQWFWADTRQQLPGLSLALMALMLAMAANVGVSTMVSSFRLTFVGFLDQRLASELYVTATDAEQAEAVSGVAAGQAVAVLPLLSAERTIAGLPAEIYGARDHATYRDNWRFLQAVPDVWDLLAQGKGVLVNEQLFRRGDYGLGALLPLSSGLALPVLGIYGDYGNPVGQVIVTEALFRATFPNVVALRFGLRVGADEVDNLRALLVQEAGVAPGAMIDQAAIKAASLSVFERTFTVTTALNVLTLAVAGFAMLMSLLTLAAMRLPQLAPVWALGVTRVRLSLMDLMRTVILAALTAVLALPLGLGLAWALLAIINVEAFGWRLPMYLFWMDYLELAGFALLAAALAALWPAWRLWRSPPARLLGVFRHER
jgi:putative ABC transport system permease protein